MSTHEDRQLIDRFIEMLSAERGAAEYTRAAYTRGLRDFLAFVVRRSRPLAAAKTADITAYLRAVAEDGLSAASRARRLSAIRQLYRFLASEGVVGDDPAE